MSDYDVAIAIRLDPVNVDGELYLDAPTAFDN